MCGIVGIINLDKKSISEIELINFRDSLTHRGPDGKGIFIDKNIGLGHRRLSIIDLTKNGHQPMIFDDRYVITYNGECYNFEELKHELIQKGLKFKTNTDTEVILAGYKMWGSKIQFKMNGMWAFAIYDKKTRETFISRDRFGIKPIYYLITKNIFYFASEMKSFMHLDKPNIPSFDDDVLINLRIHESIENTFLKNVFCLPSGHSIKITSDNIIKKEKWWKTENHLISINENNMIDDFFEIFINSLKLTLVSDVKIAFTLSGGIDSTSLAFATKFIDYENKLKDRTSPDYNNFFSIKYKGSMKEDDLVVQKLKDKFNVNVLELDKEKFSNDNIVKNCYYFESIEESAIGPFELYKNIKSNGFKVTIDGHGPDELMGGYDTHIIFALIDNFFSTSKFKNINFLSKEITKNDLSMNRAQIASFLLKKIIKKLINHKDKIYLYQTNPELFNIQKNIKFYKKPEKNNFLSYLNNKLFNDFHFGSQQDILRKFDRISMANSIESRVPYLDFRIVAYCFSLLPYFKINKNTKEIFRTIMKKKINLPDYIINRKIKEGFVSPPEWYQNNMLSFIKDTINNIDFKDNLTFCKVDTLKKYIEKPNYSKLKRAFLFCQVYYLKKTFKNASVKNISH